ncbi:MAG: AAA family ATPase [Microcella sp.]|uniref:AAA family ATPase n=1 Tax=Microcella sp. TaxID=1913979 RepID=UPI003315385C
MSTENFTTQRLRRAVEVLADDSQAHTRNSVWESVIDDFPLSEREQGLNSNGDMKGKTDWLFATSDLTTLGWMAKDGAGGWSITAAGRDALTMYSDAETFRRAAREGYSAVKAENDAAKLSILSTAIVPASPEQETVVATAKLFVERGLAELDSVFAPGRAVWTAPVAAELVERFVNAPDAAGGSFTEKMSGQFASASDDARLLMAELVALQLLPASSTAIGAAKKAERIETVLRLMDHPVQIPDEIKSAFGSGSFNPGTRMMQNLYGALVILINFVSDWVALDDDQRLQLLEDPWEFRTFVRAVNGEPFPSQRLALMYLVHPGTFTSIVQTEAREKIRNAFIGETGREPSDDLDRDLKDIWIALQVKNKKPIHFWMPQFLSVWSEPRLPDPIAPVAPTHDDEDEDEAKAMLAFPQATGELADELLIPQKWLQDTLDLIERRRQVILYGPPGTGKTFLARVLAKHASGGRAPTIVQFHPSYSYEDFVAGYRPQTDAGQLGYVLKPGPLLRIAAEATKNPEQAFFLVIDEINRGNIAKVFGELYFLLEYRDEGIELLYGDEGAAFSLPSNVFFIGTMNTADRSIALLDAAMRRRFAFVELHPDEEPTSGLLPRWLARHDLPPESANLLAALNATVSDRDARIGPSYLMPGDHDLSEARLAQIWKHEILPLLEESLYGDGRDIPKEFGLEALRRRIARADETIETFPSDVTAIDPADAPEIANDE